MDTIIVIDPTSQEQTVFQLTDDDFIKTYVPEAGDCNLSFEEALKLAEERSEQAAVNFEASVEAVKELTIG
jgi:hypothetical protein